MKLKRLIQGLDISEIKGSKEIDITGICSDSRRTAPGNLFVARRGSAIDGNTFIPQAIDNGAVAVLTAFYNPFIKQITQLIHPEIETMEAELVDRFYDHPSKKLFVFGVTGTKGKTTTSYLVKHLLDSVGKKCGLISTVETIIGEKRTYSTLTTHDVVQNHKLLYEMVQEGSSSVALEVSSHGLMQGRVDRIDFDAALFTKLTPDHLDYHKTMEEYALAKKRLFTLLNQSSKPNRCAIANGDDSAVNILLDGCKVKKLLFGLNEGADVRAENISFSPEGTHFTVRYQEQFHPFFTTLIGRFNVYNTLGVIALGLHLGFSLPTMAKIFASFQTVPGRLERVENSQGKHIFIDYAHNGDALNNVLATLREIARGRILAVFGAGGNRDPGRRTGLAIAAEKGADVSIITSDNPRQEDPSEIARQILSGFKEKKNVMVELDRKLAIQKAIQMAQEEDIVLIAGKGHERVQIFANHSVPFDDHQVAIDALKHT